MNERPLMKCGHTAHAVVAGTDKPVCPSCIGISPGADEVDEDAPDLEGRKSKCTYCKSVVDSSYGLPFFEYRGPGSYHAIHSCKHCWFFDSAHGLYHKCKNFEPKGGVEFDNHYDGCRGFD